MAKRQGGRKQKQRVSDNAVRIVRSEQIGKVVQTLIRCTAFVIPFYFAYRAIVETAGQTTIINVVANVAATIGFDDWIAYVFGIIGMAFGFLERRLRKQHAANLGVQNKKLEELLDRSRGSSGLDEKGDAP